MLIPNMCMVLGIIEFLWEEWVKTGVFWTFLGFLSFYGRTKQVKVKMKTDSESA